MNPIKCLARKNIQSLTPYLSARRIGGSGEIWLNANEAPDCSVYQLEDQHFNRYPEFQPAQLIHAYAKYASVKNEQILSTRGADESIELLIRTFCEPNQDRIIICPPTYGMYAISAQTSAVGVCEIALDTDFNVDYKAIEQTLLNEKNNIKIVFLCSPNNPSANMLDKVQLINLLHSAKNKALIVIDEAYIEFCNVQTLVNLIAEHENLVILRTLSKAFALASIRCGFSLAQEHIINMLAKVIAPYPIPSPVAKIATQALSTQGIQTMLTRVALLNKNRQILYQALQALPCVDTIFCSTANFLLVRFNDAPTVFNALHQAGIVMRDFSNQPRLHNCIRISIGSKAEMTATLSILNSL
ncbi:histidinol-phosphate transaminase [Psychromonas sp. CD1]|uniref:histidinol-phosphate transaminase n=1 Tax=Psychromonas sp. CD1 TaxID=1979839 RepID=UPI000B9A8317|nr:histidinol-phosphate transaminase [Psychromonas sp. CD1]